MEQPNTLNVAAIFGFSLHSDLVGTPEAAEVIDVQAAQEGLQGIGHIGNRHTQFLGFFPVDRKTISRRARIELGIDAADFRALAGSSHEIVGHLGEFLWCAAGAVLQLEREATGRTQAWNGWRVEGKDDGLR